MLFLYTYKPIQFFLFTFLGTWIPWFIAAYFSHQKGKEKLQVPFLILGLFAPFIVALLMIFGSTDHALVQDFFDRLLLYKIGLSSLFMILVVIPGVFFLATALSVLFGKSSEQFTLANEFNVMKGWSLLSLVIPLLLAPGLEELGWRGYGVDSLRSEFNLFNTSMLFAVLWALWHVPLFFIKGYYHYELLKLNIAYVFNFFISILPVAFLINWLYYKNSRSILIAVFAHALFNGLSVFFKTEQFTKCLFTLLLCLVAIVLIFKDSELFF